MPSLNDSSGDQEGVGANPSVLERAGSEGGGWMGEKTGGYMEGSVPDLVFQCMVHS